MKPVLTTEEALKDIDLSKYTIERKFDGWRVVIINDGRLKFYTRQKREIQVSDSIKKEVHSMALPKGTVMDGEVWNPLKRAEWTNIDIWDIMKNGTTDLKHTTIEERRKILSSRIHGGTAVKNVEYYDASLEFIEQIKKEAWEVREKENQRSGFIHGVVLKKRRSFRHDSANRSTENSNWLKVVFDGMKGYEPR